MSFLPGYPYSDLGDFQYPFLSGLPYLTPTGTQWKSGTGAGPYLGDHCYPCPHQCSWPSMAGRGCRRDEDQRMAQSLLNHHATTQCFYNTDAHNQTSCIVRMHPLGDKSK